MSIKEYIDEMDLIETEISNNNAKNRILRKRYKELDAQISDYIKSKDHTGIRYKDKALVLITEDKHHPLKKKREGK